MGPGRAVKARTLVIAAEAVEPPLMYLAVSAQSGLRPITIESGPSNGSTRVDTIPASRIQA
ncbi:hypothetical protein RPHASCH2410_PD04745 (plasmid) [Rhizobium phaseoli Ch24-10]|nr:hypothetical protein RPHASCH2410_PD04745 [Rhizobium phaseoli Ch24-10]